MATAFRRPTDPVTAHVADRLGRTNYYQAVRLLLARPHGEAWPLEERVRFSAELSHAFPGHEISNLMEQADDNAKTPVCCLSTPNYCIAGGLGPLPPAYTEWLRDQVRADNDAAVRFLDLFNHRLNLNRYRLKESRTPALNNLPPEQSTPGRQLTALCGLSAPRGALPLRSLLGIAGLLSDCRRSAAGLTRVLSRYLGAAVQFTPFIGAWSPVEEDDRMALGRRNHGLGQSAVLGRKVWDQRARVRLTVGPLDHSLFRRLLPPRPSELGDKLHQGFVELVRLLLSRRHDCEIRLEVRPETVGESVLTASPRRTPTEDGQNDAGLLLGETAWLRRPGQEARHTAEFLIPAFGEVTTV